MDWNCNVRPHFVSQPDSHLSFFCNYNYDPYQEEMKHLMQPAANNTTMLNSTMMEKNMNYGNNQLGVLEKKKQRLTSDQLEALEKSFQEEIKLDPDRKTKLSKELGMEPRQIAVWFQNRRARWRTKELERLYETLKMEYDVVSRQKDKLQEEVVALRGIIREQGGRINTEMSGEETVESTSMPTSNNLRAANTANMNNQHMPGESFMYNNIDDYNGVLPPPPAYWAGLPTYQ